MTTLQTTVGSPAGPVPGNATYYNENLRNAVVHFMFVNNVPENGLLPSPDYISNPCEATLSRCNGNVWVAGDKIIIAYSKI